MEYNMNAMYGLFLMLLCVCCVCVTGADDPLPQAQDNNDTIITEIHRFIDIVGGEEPADLIIIMDRSLALSKKDFYLKSSPLARKLVSQYVSAHVEHTRLAVLTFAINTTVAIDFISPGADRSTGDGSKAQLFHGDTPLWDERVRYIDGDEHNKGTNLKAVLVVAREIMRAGRNERGRSIRQTVLVMSDGNIGNSEEDYPYEAGRDLKSDGVEVFTVAVGKWKNTGNVQIVASEGEFHGYYQQWVDLAEERPFAMDNDVPNAWMEVDDSLCDGGHVSHAACFSDLYSGVTVWMCEPGYHLTEHGNCTECPMGFYSSEYTLDTECTACPAEGNTTTTAATAADECVCDGNANTNDTAATQQCTDVCALNTTVCDDGKICEALNATSYECVCPRGFTGPDCSENIDDCTDNNVCGRHGVCHDRVDDYYCSCDIGYLGRNCELIQDNCVPGMCVNNATCENEVNGFECDCAEDYVGEYCQDYRPKTPPTTAAPTTPEPNTTLAPSTPPTSPPRRSSTTPKSDNYEDNKDDSKDSNLIIIIAAAAGGVLVLIIIITVICICVIQRRRRREQDEAKLPPPPQLFEKPGYQRKYSSKSNIRKTISKKFSGLWKNRTVRGEFDSEKAEGTPSAPTKQRPDLLALSNVNLVDEVQFQNQMIEEDTSMNGWKSYMKDLESSTAIKSACIAKIESYKHACTQSFTFHEAEIDSMVQVLKSTDINVPVHVQNGEYRITENTGTIAVGTSMAGEQEGEVLIIGNTAKFLIISITSEDESKMTQCRNEVQWLIDHISGEGY